MVTTTTLHNTFYFVGVIKTFYNVYIILYNLLGIPGSCPEAETAHICQSCKDVCKADTDCPGKQEKCCCHSSCGSYCYNVA